MKYALLRAPHANAHYDAELGRLTAAEFACIADAMKIDARLQPERMGGLLLLTFEADLNERQQKAIGRISHLLALFSVEGENLRPLMGRQTQGAFGDMPSILKYKGKTNESFTRLMVNLAAFSCADPERFDQKLTLLDPMCGRGTTLYCALGYGYDALGIEPDKKEVQEAVAFIKAYLRNGRCKHSYKQSSVTVNGRAAGPVHAFETAADPEDYKAGKKLSLKFAYGDGGLVEAFYRKQPADLLVADLPYGIQHGNDHNHLGKDTLGMMRRLLPEWKKCLRPGGAMALSFNAYTIKRSDLCAALKDAGFEPVESDWTEGLCHWVEQAILRDVVVARR